MNQEHVTVLDSALFVRFKLTTTFFRFFACFSISLLFSRSFIVFYTSLLYLTYTLKLIIDEWKYDSDCDAHKILQVPQFPPFPPPDSARDICAWQMDICRILQTYCTSLFCVSLYLHWSYTSCQMLNLHQFNLKSVAVQRLIALCVTQVC